MWRFGEGEASTAALEIGCGAWKDDYVAPVLKWDGPLWTHGLNTWIVLLSPHIEGQYSIPGGVASLIPNLEVIYAKVIQYRQKIP